MVVEIVSECLFTYAKGNMLIAGQLSLRQRLTDAEQMSQPSWVTKHAFADHKNASSL
jgi:hypothetical protein